MNRSGLFVSMCLGVALLGAGCGEPAATQDKDPVGSQSQDIIYCPLSPVTGVAQCPDDPGDPGDPPPPSGDTGPGMNLSTYQYYAANNQTRCAGGISQSECLTELQYALTNQLITAAAYNWGTANGYYPAVDRYNKIAAVCKCGCFEANTQILVEGRDGFAEWVAAKTISQSTKLVALDENTTLSAPGFISQSIKAKTAGAERPDLFVFTLDNGRTLKVTQNHGMLLADGRVVEAKTLGAGAEFVGLDGATVRVTSLSREPTALDVYNFEVNADDKAGHFVAAEGVLVGDLAWQNQLARELGSIAVRR
ncbi:hypothetical protein [Corallococcus carmarthensis]|nr:hypothetical protein [Corallococcus carmarthensis]